MKNNLIWALLIAITLTSRALGAEKEAPFEIYGFAQGDYIQDFKRVNPAWVDTLRPSKISTIPGTYGTDGQAAISPKQSRLGVNGNIPAGDSHIQTKIEFDFFGVGVDEGQTTIRLRHAYGQWGHWLAGQTHSLFMDVDVFPNVIDYWGPAGIVFLRNPQIRWIAIEGDLTLSFAIEHPSDDIDSGQIRELDPGLGTNIQADEKLPDFTAQIRKQGDWGHLQLGGILRRIGYETLKTAGNEPNGRKIGWGFDLSSNIKFREKDKLILAGVFGQGIASYMNDGGTDLAPDGTPGNVTAKAVPLFGLTAYYDLYWNERFSSSFGYSRTQVENTALQEGDAFFSR